MSRFLVTAWLVLRKDLTVEVRSLEIALTTIFFAVSTVMVFAFALVREGQPPEDGAAGILWIAIAFAGTLALGRTFEAGFTWVLDRYTGSLDWALRHRRVVGAVALASANIIDAKIVTFADGMALDTLSVVDPTGLEFADESRLMRLKQKIEDVLRGRIRLAREFEKASKQGLFKKSSPFTIPPRVLIDSNGSETDTIIEVNCHDRLGLLYDITSTLTALGLKISSAHVATYGERAVDVFYVKDLFGLKVVNQEKLKQIAATVEKSIRDFDARFEPAVKAAE